MPGWAWRRAGSQAQTRPRHRLGLVLLFVQQMLLLKFADHNEELTDEIELIERHTPTINVARYIFEYASLSLPMKRLHPRFRTEDIDTDDDLLIYRTDTSDESDTSAQAPQTDPRWEALRKLSDN